MSVRINAPTQTIAAQAALFYSGGNKAASGRSGSAFSDLSPLGKHSANASAHEPLANKVFQALYA